MKLKKRVSTLFFGCVQVFDGEIDISLLRKDEFYFFNSSFLIDCRAFSSNVNRESREATMSITT